MDQDLFEWLLLLGRWIHITTGITWIGTSIFFMWLDRSFEKNNKSTRPGHLGELWMVHGGGFYNVEKLQMGPTKVPNNLHWFKWESYWTWMSGFYLLSMIFYTNSGTFLLDPSVSSITYLQGVLLSLGTIFGSWFFYDALWEHPFTKEKPREANIVTLILIAGITFLLCKTLSGRAAYLHVGAILGTWMAGNVFLRIVPRQVKMVEAAKKGETVNPDWAVNAKNRSTHNTYFTLPVIFIMLSNHFPMTYGHNLNWLVLLIICVAGASIRRFFVVRLSDPFQSRKFLLAGVALLVGVILFTRQSGDLPVETQEVAATPVVNTVPDAQIPATELPDTPVVPNIQTPANEKIASKLSSSSSVPAASTTFILKGVVKFEGTPPEAAKITLPQACAPNAKGSIRSNEIMISNGKVKNVLVRVVQGQEKLPKGNVPDQAAVLDQHNCMYEPRLIAARVGQEVVFVNSDDVFHNVKSLSKENPAFNIGMAQKNQRVSKRFSKAEIVVETKCSVHPWMAANIAVMDHPYFAITKADGSFEIPGLPPGKYTIEFWHEILGSKSEEITVAANGIDPVSEVFKGK
jgi:uncharacterized membrane protein/plastocyanin